MRITNADILPLLPEFMRSDPSTLVLAQAIRPEILRLTAQARHALLLPRLDKLPDEILDELAVEYDIGWYFSGADIEAKRAVIREAFAIHRHFGTPWAIERVSEMYFGDALVQESWEYEAEPYHFRVATGNVAEGTRQAEIFIELVGKLKNARSVFDGLFLDSSVGVTSLFFGAPMQVARIMTMEPALKPGQVIPQ